jgi:hypothetical protein
MLETIRCVTPAGAQRRAHLIAPPRRPGHHPHAHRSGDVPEIRRHTRDQVTRPGQGLAPPDRSARVLGGLRVAGRISHGWALLPRHTVGELLEEIRDLGKQHRDAMAAVPHGFIDSISLLVRYPDRFRMVVPFFGYAVDNGRESAVLARLTRSLRARGRTTEVWLPRSAVARHPAHASAWAPRARVAEDPHVPVPLHDGGRRLGG